MPFRILWIIAGVAIASVLLGCNGEEASLSEEKAEKEAESTDVARVIALESANQYKVSLHWEQQTSVDRWLIHRRKSPSAAELTQVGLVAPQETTFEDDTVVAGTTYTYFVSSLVGDKLTIHTQATVSIPTDFVVSGERSDIHELRGINRLFFARDSRLITGEQGLVIQAAHLISDSGAIETFPEGHRADLPDKGRNAGGISIEVQSAEGRLVILNRGEGGAKGNDGVAGANGQRGSKGRDGDFDTNPELVTRGRLADWAIRGYKKHDLSVYSDPNNPAWKRCLGNIPWYICTVRPENGAQGEAGKPGQEGGPGTDGGNSARVFINVKNDSPIFFDVTNEPGLPGPGGLGGAGGVGGPGGPPGAQDFPRICPAAQNGPPGPNGAPGTNGASGKAGFREPVCTVVAGQKSEGCRHFRTEGK